MPVVIIPENWAKEVTSDNRNAAAACMSSKYTATSFSESSPADKDMKKVSKTKENARI